LKDGQLTAKSLSIIEKAFAEEYFKVATPREDYNGVQHIYFKVLTQMLKNTLLLDRKNSPFEILELEKMHIHNIYINSQSVKIGGIIDRIDRTGGSVRVVDYKTGSAPKAGDYAKTIADIVEQKRKPKDKYRFQTFLYSCILQRERFCTELPTPALLFPLAADSDDYSPELPFDSDALSEFEDAFTGKLQELFDENTPFSQCEKPNACKYCDYTMICRR